MQEKHMEKADQRCRTDVLLTTVLPGLFAGIVQDEMKHQQSFFSRSCLDANGSVYRLAYERHKAANYKDVDVVQQQVDENACAFFVNRRTPMHAHVRSESVCLNRFFYVQGLTWGGPSMRG